MNPAAPLRKATASSGSPLTFSQAVAYALSLLAHPLTMPTWLATFLTFYLPDLTHLPLQNRYLLIGLIFLFTFLMPGLGTLGLRLLGIVDSLTLEKRHQRIVPMVLSLLIYLAFAYALYQNSGRYLPSVIYLLVVSVAASIAVVLGVTFFWKISAHATGVGGTCAALLAFHLIYNTQPLFLAFAFSWTLAGAVITARLYLQAHTVSQILAGFTAGFIVNFVIISLYY